VDLKSEAGGKLAEDWDLLPPESIPDPDVKEPGDWDKREFIPDTDD